jgi:transposase
MAKAAGISHTMVGRIWRTFRLQPHRTESFTLSPDPQLVEKIRDVVGLYVAPPANAVVFSVDEKSQIQALQRAQPILPMDFGQPERRTHNYVRHGTLDLFAALNVATGEVIARCKPQHRAQDFVAFLREIESSVESTLDVHVVLDNLSAHRAPPVQRWLLRHPRVHFHFTPTYASLAQSGGAVLWIPDGKSAQAWIAHQHCAVARLHSRVCRRPQRARHTLQMGKDRRRDSRQHAAIWRARSAGARSMTLLTLDHMRLTLGLTMSPRTVGRYFRTLGPPARRAAVPAVRDVCAESCARGPREVVPAGHRSSWRWPSGFGPRKIARPLELQRARIEHAVRADDGYTTAEHPPPDPDGMRAAEDLDVDRGTGPQRTHRMHERPAGRQVQQRDSVPRTKRRPEVREERALETCVLPPIR